jgi:heme/copper-type cytochrome/quinol oxidase subunit 2
MSAAKFFRAHLRTTYFSPMNQPLAETIFWIAVVACAVAEVAILRSTFAARRANRSDLVPASSRSGELAWAVIPALALCAVLVATWQRVEARESHMQMMDHSGMGHPMQMPSPQPPAPRS